MRRLLARARPKWELVSASSTDSALIELFDKQFDVVVTDLEMAGASGLALVEAVSLHCPEVSCVVHSARLADYLGHPSLRRVARLVGKPAEPENLVGVLNDALWTSVTTRRSNAERAAGHASA